MERTVVGVFDSGQQAQSAKQALLSCGVPQDRVHIESQRMSMMAGKRDEERHEGGFLAWLRDLFTGDEDYSREYTEAVRRGGFVLVADAVDDAQLEQVTSTMSHHGAVDIDKRVAGWRDEGWTGTAMRGDAETDDVAMGDVAMTDATLRQDTGIAGGMRTVNSGGVRIHTRTAARPVEEQVRLREERTDVFAADDLNAVLRDELSATETYRQALDKNRDQYGQDARYMQLAQMLRDHEQAASQLRTLITSRGGRASDDSGAWGAWSNAVMGAARLFGDKAALKALKEGEESGIKDYQSLLRDGSPSEIRNVVTSIVAREQEHVRQLDRLIQAA